MRKPFRTRHVVVEGVRGPVLINGGESLEEAAVFVHGNPDVGADWKPLMEKVSHLVPVVAPDMPGFGGADKRPDQDYTLAAYASYLGGVIEQLGIRRVHVIAHDFGGLFALSWAAANPDRVASVTLINTGVLLDYRWHRLARLWRTPIVGELAQKASIPAVARWLLRHDNPGLPRDWADRIADHLMPEGTKRAVLRLYRSTGTQHMDALVEPLRRLNPETLVIWGSRDAYIPVAQADRQRRVFPNARIVILPGVGHWAWLEHPEAVADLVIPFLRDRVHNNTTQQVTTTRKI